MKIIHVALIILVALVHFSNASIRKPSTGPQPKKPTNEVLSNKEKSILENIQILTKEMHMRNITLIGSQNVYNLDGSLKEIRTVELAIPNIEDDDYTILYDLKPDVIAEVIYRQLEGLNIELYSRLFEGSGLNEELYMPNELTAFRDKEGPVINQTIHVKDIRELENDYKSRCKICKNGITSRLALDDNGKVISSKSSVAPELHATIEECKGEPSLDIIETTFNKFVTTVQEAEDLETVPETLRNILQDKYPNVTFLASTAEISNYYMPNDFSINIAYHDSLKVEPDLFVYGYYNTPSE